MPRRNNRQKVERRPIRIEVNPKNKKRFSSRQEAERAAEIIMASSFTLEIRVYRGLDGGWYLTSKK